MGRITRTRFGLVKTKTLTNAQMLDLTTPVIITPGIAGKILFPLFAFFSFVWTADYGGIDGITELTISSGNGTPGLQLRETPNGDITALLAAGASATGWFPLQGAVASNLLIGQAGYLTADAAGKPITIASSDAFTGGDPLNVVNVTLCYMAIPVA